MISVIIPVYNEQGNLVQLHARLSEVMRSSQQGYELVFINDGSRDGSLAIIQQLAGEDSNVRYIDLSRNFGHQIAVSAGLDQCGGEAAVIIDADLQDPPELINEMLIRWKNGDQVVYAQRISRKGESRFKKWTAGMFYRILRMLTNVDIPIDTGDFRLIDRSIIDLLKDMPEKNKFLRGQIAWMGFNQSSVEYVREERHSGSSGYSFGKMLKLAMDGITSFSNVPLRLVTAFGFLCSFVAFIIMVYAIYAKYAWSDTVPGWASLMVSVLFLGGVQMLALGVIGEYLSRINDNARGRPLYIIRDKNF